MRKPIQFKTVPMLTINILKCCTSASLMQLYTALGWGIYWGILYTRKSYHHLVFRSSRALPIPNDRYLWGKHAMLNCWPTKRWSPGWSVVCRGGVSQTALSGFDLPRPGLQEVYLNGWTPKSTIKCENSSASANQREKHPRRRFWKAGCRLGEDRTK